MQLLDRLGRGATPTRAGQLLLGYARRMLTLSREAHQALERFQGRMSGELVIGGSTIPGEYVLPALIGQFKAKYPDISISLLIGSTRQVAEWLDEGRAPTTRTLEAKELMPDELVVVVPASHPWATRRTTTLGDLQKEPMVVRERGSGSREAVEHALQEAGVPLASLRIVGEMGSTQAVKQAVRAGVGVSLISQRAVVDECRARLLACVKIRDLTVSRAFHMITHRERTRSPLAQAFLTFVESQLAGQPS